MGNQASTNQPNALRPGWRSSPWTRRFLPVVIAVYLALAGAYTHYLPPGQAPDEHAHFEYVLFLAQNGRLPRIWLKLTTLTALLSLSH